MAILFDTQPECNEPVAYTHFDTWFEDDEDDIHERQMLAQERFEDASIEQLTSVTVTVLASWEKELGIDIVSSLTGDVFGGSVEQAVLACGFDNFWSLVVQHVLSEGFDVFVGSVFIEVYKVEEAKPVTFSVKPDKFWTSDEYDVQPSKITVTYDPSVIAKAEFLLAEYPWIGKVTTSEGVNFEVNKRYEGKPMGGVLVVTKGYVSFEFFNGNTNTTYECEVPA